jgi:ATP-dependent RNA helicase DDX10/DBP4
MLKSTEMGKKLIFDDEGKPHELYEMADAEEFFKAGPEGVKDAGKKFVESERGRLRVADILDKEEAKEKKREKKRKRKERERADVTDDDLGPAPIVASFLDEDGYVSPEFDLLSGDDEDLPPPTKRNKTAPQNVSRRSAELTLDDEEELASRLLRQR